MFIVIFLIVGFILLIMGAKWLINGASSIAKRMNVSDLIIGLTVIAFGTSAPELIVNIIASFKNTPEIAVGSILGSNISNILLILGITAIIYPLKMKKNTIWREIPFSLFSILIVALIVSFTVVDGERFLLLSRVDGLVLVSFFVLFMYYIFRTRRVSGEEEINVRKYKTWQSVSLIILGIIGLTWGGNLIVNGATMLARAVGISQSVIGLTLVAFGTSLPELAVSVVAALRKNPDIAVGNVVGSNIFNILWVLGISSMIRPLVFSVENNIHIMMTIVVSLLLFSFLFIGKRHILQRWQGVIFVLLYFGYVVFLFTR